MTLFKLLIASCMFYGALAAAYSDSLADPGTVIETRELRGAIQIPKAKSGGSTAPVRSRGLGAGVKTGPGLLSFE